MDSTVSGRFHWKTFIVSCACICGAAVGIYYLYLDLNGSGTQGHGKPVGKVERREAQVRRKTASSYIWNNIQANENLYRKDSIQTGRGSAAIIRLEDGNLLEIAENSLVVMDDTTNLSLSYLKGSVVLHKKDGDSKITVDQNGKTKVEEIPIRLLKPEPLARFFISGKDPKEITFSWEAKVKSPTESFVLQVSTDRRFNPKWTKNFGTSDPHLQSLKIPLIPGKYFWRVWSKSASVDLAREFRIINAVPLQPVWPENQQKIVTWVGESAAQFRWVSPRSMGQEDADLTQGDHRIELASDPTFNRIIVSESINVGVGATTLHGVPNGTIYWRIKSTYGTFTVFSPARVFDLKSIPKPATDLKNSKNGPGTHPSAIPSLQAPELPVQPPPPPPPISPPKEIHPAPNAEFKLLQMKEPPEISWSKVDDAKAYEVVVYSDLKTSHQKKLVIHEKTEKTHLSLKKLVPGEYLWTIRTIDKKDHPGNTIPFRRLIVSYGEVLAPPQIVSPEVQ